MLAGVIVGIGSQILVLGSGATVLIQCPFISEIQGRKQQRHGAGVTTSELLFDYLNCQVTSASMGVLVFKSEGESH